MTDADFVRPVLMHKNSGAAQEWKWREKNPGPLTAPGIFDRRSNVIEHSN